MSAERNLFRYVSPPMLIRLSPDVPPSVLLRVAGTGILAGATLKVSTIVVLPEAMLTAFEVSGIDTFVHTEDVWLSFASKIRGNRIRVIDDAGRSLAHLAATRPNLVVYGQRVTEAGRVEMLPFLKEQSISITAHRFGTPSRLTDDII